MTATLDPGAIARLSVAVETAAADVANHTSPNGTRWYDEALIGRMLAREPVFAELVPRLLTTLTELEEWDAVTRESWADALIEVADLKLRVEELERERDTFEARWALAEGEAGRLAALINTPQTADFFEAVKLEAAHQIERWGSEHDAGKTPADWFWLIGYLAGKALHDVGGKRLHHVITAAAALLNWHRALTGESTAMRPGIEPP